MFVFCKLSKNIFIYLKSQYQKLTVIKCSEFLLQENGSKKSITKSLDENQQLTNSIKEVNSSESFKIVKGTLTENYYNPKS